ncbi:hypothetical protein LZD49_05055 [Dyadobacter sp. CY261]|uniref:hypothetical protein n=1 Tax=Dyadobacter sp. CY261 TaxID=2907203 RepID=UPI001F47561D|nr:hypothetical protein [Dyadobacter sp. CY261]MCF0069829.1 hypothetical protein [Dyadobacter sp. CY261]
MIKELLKYLLPLCILLVDGISNMYAGSQESAPCTAPIQILAQSAHPNFVKAADPDSPAFRLPDAARRFAEFIKAISEEKEEDSTESFSVKKQPRSGSIPTAALAPRYDFQFRIIPKTRALTRLGLLVSSHRYLVLRVLRI